MFDHQFAKGADFDKAYRIIESKIDVIAYKPLAKAFADNLHRVKSIGMLPMQLLYWSTLFATAMTKAQVSLGVVVGAQGVDERSSAVANQFVAEVMRQRDLQSLEEQEADLLGTHGHNLGLLIKDDVSGHIAAGHDAILSAMVVEAWSAFEALSIDLWVAALNKHPSTLAVEFSKKNGEKTITLDQLNAYDFDISSKMGLIIKNFGKVRFESLPDISKAYSSTFGVETKGITDNKPMLFIAEKVRHLIAHRSGLVDEKFLDNCAGKPPFCDFSVGTRIPLDGGMVASLVSACVHAGVNLLMLVDRYSVSHDQATS